jgi:hypothetical protein
VIEQARQQAGSLGDEAVGTIIDEAVRAVRSQVAPNLRPGQVLRASRGPPLRVGDSGAAARLGLRTNSFSGRAAVGRFSAPLIISQVLTILSSWAKAGM